ncbi:similar to Saccharomyces cerevisiae YOL110W SHR5 Subunit of a palmitoyltransferase [Maudiozyma saulgeensis]|uniref:Ras modification protein ERF4 n=1 Tax=Maudiozyma saulgeensis TaxID=1789683 RepID=A0A1X7R9X7_9SACH|nr:similar to Saccharomyces cerevisiae YOL110W SHR5 Subunit of a palmitoyltransferase [Kazachstania saulgeensis]
MSDQLSEEEEAKVLFFNYHEFSETYYADIDNPAIPREHDESEALIITHFPNVYTPQNTQLYKETRIVRIPRRFEESVQYPNFSELLPGLEPAAIINDNSSKNDDIPLPNKFIARGVYDNDQIFGTTSTSPLSLYFTPEQFRDIVHGINILLKEEYQVFSWWNILDIILTILTLNLWIWLSDKLHVRVPMHIKKLDLHIKQLNESQLLASQRVRIMHPSRAAYLSLDFEIPKPVA